MISDFPVCHYYGHCYAATLLDSTDPFCSASASTRDFFFLYCHLFLISFHLYFIQLYLMKLLKKKHGIGKCCVAWLRGIHILAASNYKLAEMSVIAGIIRKYNSILNMTILVFNFYLVK